MRQRAGQASCPLRTRRRWNGAGRPEQNLPDGDQLQQSAAEIQRALYVALEKTERALEKLEDAMKHAEENAPALEDARQAALSAARSCGGWPLT